MNTVNSAISSNLIPAENTALTNTGTAEKEFYQVKGMYTEFTEKGKVLNNKLFEDLEDVFSKKSGSSGGDKVVDAKQDESSALKPDT